MKLLGAFVTIILLVGGGFWLGLIFNGEVRKNAALNSLATVDNVWYVRQKMEEKGNLRTLLDITVAKDLQFIEMVYDFSGDGVPVAKEVCSSIQSLRQDLSDMGESRIDSIDKESDLAKSVGLLMEGCGYWP